MGVGFEIGCPQRCALSPEVSATTAFPLPSEPPSALPTSVAETRPNPGPVKTCCFILDFKLGPELKGADGFKPSHLISEEELFVADFGEWGSCGW